MRTPFYCSRPLKISIIFLTFKKKKLKSANHSMIQAYLFVICKGFTVQLTVSDDHLYTIQRSCDPLHALQR